VGLVEPLLALVAASIARVSVASLAEEWQLESQVAANSEGLALLGVMLVTGRVGPYKSDLPLRRGPLFHHKL